MIFSSQEQPRAKPPLSFDRSAQICEHPELPQEDRHRNVAVERHYLSVLQMSSADAWGSPYVPSFGAFMSGVRTNALMTVGVALLVHLSCHTSTIVL
jgi:hypothetical protein